MTPEEIEEIERLLHRVTSTVTATGVWPKMTEEESIRVIALARQALAIKKSGVVGAMKLCTEIEIEETSPSNDTWNGWHDCRRQMLVILTPALTAYEEALK